MFLLIIILTLVVSISSFTSGYTHTRLTTLFPGLRRWAGTRKGKPIWILLKHETVSGSGISWAMCKSPPRSRQITAPAPHHSVFYRPDALPAAQPTASKHRRQASGYNEMYISRFWQGNQDRSLVVTLQYDLDKRHISTHQRVQGDCSRQQGSFWSSTAGLKNIAHTRLPSVGFQNWSRFLAVSLQVTWVINPAVDFTFRQACTAVTLATLKRAATNFAAWWTVARWGWTASRL